MISKERLVNIGITFLVAVVAAVSVNLAQFRFVPAKMPQVMVVDAAAVVTAKQKWFTDQLMKPGVTNEEREKILSQTKQFLPDLDKELSRMQADCKCIIFDKGAVIIGNYTDVTDTVKKRLSL